MCIFDYHTHSCGHPWYRYIRPTALFCGLDRNCPAPSLEHMDEHRCDLLYDCVVFESVCEKCEQGELDRTRDLHLKNLQGMISLLEQAIEDLSETEVKAASRARRALHLLSRMSEADWSCSKWKPSQGEMQRYVIHTADSVEKVTRSTEKRAVQHVLCPAVSPFTPADTTANTPATFSEDSIERQLCNLVPRSPLIELQKPTHHRSRVYPARVACFSSHPLVQTAPRLVPVDPVTPGGNFTGNMVLSSSFTQVRRDSDEESIITNPHCSTPSHTFVGFAPHMSSYASEKRTVKTDADGRDGWDCDFCGLECFCFGLDD